ncbi:MFS transporter [Brevibacterium zhoupengii]|uniref:MFS transporter n=1 Tax=Brevibacterium zhoupengii TaxID=2898795 RepID=UPI001E5F867A|nr:MFS transporter [Brevibacterium zhoupengii]
MSTNEQRGPNLGLLTVLTGAVGAGPLLLYGLSATSDQIISELVISEAHFGLLATVCFGCAAIGNAILGRVADRRSDLLLMAAVFLLAAASFVLAALPAGFGLLLVAAGLSGVAQSFPNGVTNRILLERVPEARRIGWVGIKQSGVQVSQLVSSLAFPALALAMGWRGAALTITVIPLVLLVVAWRSLRSTPLLPSAAAPHTDTAEVAAGNGTLPSESSRPAHSPYAPRYPGMVWALAAFGLLNGIGVQATNVYMPLFAVRELGFSLVLGGVTAAMAGVIGVIARVSWARAMARGASGLRLLLILALIALGGATLFLVAGVSAQAWLLWVAVALHGISALGVSVVLMSALMRSIPSASMASASGMVTAGMFAGFAVGPLGMGLLLGSAGGFTAGWIAVAVVYLLCAVLAAALIRGTGARRQTS